LCVKRNLRIATGIAAIVFTASVFPYFGSLPFIKRGWGAPALIKSNSPALNFHPKWLGSFSHLRKPIVYSDTTGTGLITPSPISYYYSIIVKWVVLYLSRSGLFPVFQFAHGKAACLFGRRLVAVQHPDYRCQRFLTTCILSYSLFSKVFPNILFSFLFLSYYILIIFFFCSLRNVTPSLHPVNSFIFSLSLKLATLLRVSSLILSRASILWCSGK